jgi:hypothetical protein
MIFKSSIKLAMGRIINNTKILEKNIQKEPKYMRCTAFYIYLSQ